MARAKAQAKAKATAKKAAGKPKAKAKATAKTTAAKSTARGTEGATAAAAVTDGGGSSSLTHGLAGAEPAVHEHRLELAFSANGLEGVGVFIGELEELRTTTLVNAAAGAKSSRGFYHQAQICGCRGKTKQQKAKYRTDILETFAVFLAYFSPSSNVIAC